jgi:hypothetical protein
MSMEEWGRRLDDFEYKIIERTELENGKLVSTVWLGMDHRFLDDGPPLIFETMVFPADGSLDELECERYSTEEEARAGHARLVKEYDTIILHEVRDRKEIAS